MREPKDITFLSEKDQESLRPYYQDIFLKQEQYYNASIPGADNPDYPKFAGYTTRSISVFDHWLNEEEYSTSEIFDLNGLFAEINNPEFIADPETLTCLEKSYHSEAKFLVWYALLYKNLDLAFFDHESKKFYKYNHFSDYMDDCQKNLREIHSMNFVVNDRECVISAGSLFTQDVHFKDIDKCKKVFEFAKDVGLFTLDWPP